MAALPSIIGLHSDEGLTSETSVSDAPDFHGGQLSSHIPIYFIKPTNDVTRRDKCAGNGITYVNLFNAVIDLTSCVFLLRKLTLRGKG